MWDKLNVDTCKRKLVCFPYMEDWWLYFNTCRISICPTLPTRKKATSKKFRQNNIISAVLNSNWKKNTEEPGRKGMQQAKQLQAYVVVSGLEQEEFYLRKLLTFFAITNPSSLNHARILFDRVESPSTFLCNTMIRAYAASQQPQLALHLHHRMHKHGQPPDKYTFPFLLKACSTLFYLRKGQEAHSLLIKYGFHSDIFVQNSLIHLYGSTHEIQAARRIFYEMDVRDIASWTSLVSCHANSGSMESARRLFDKMPYRNAVSYSAIIAGYVRKGRFKEALDLFRSSQIAKQVPNDSMIMGVLSACASLGALDLGRWVHSTHLRDQFDSRITTALIDMYFKCGSIHDAVHVFVGAKHKQVGEWTAMISGMAMHGHGERSISLFEEMIKSGVTPNVVTFVALLSGCTHAGLVNQGVSYFERMRSKFKIEPTIEHFGCIVDVLGRAGRINEAVKIITEMPVEANAAIWGALLSACRVYRNVALGEVAARCLIKEQPWNGAIYMTLLSLYRDAGRWEDVKRIKWEMKDVACRKNPGCSFIQVNGDCYEFVVGDRSYPGAFQLCSQLGELILEGNENKWGFT